LERRGALFSKTLIESVVEVDEIAFDAARLASRLEGDLKAAGVEVITACSVTRVSAGDGGKALVETSGESGPRHLLARHLFNCTYAGLRNLAGAAEGGADLRYEIAELALVQVPEELSRLGITVMDGPFFSLMPFPAEGIHSLSHVRYTPHMSWNATEHPDLDPYKVLDAYDKRSRFGYMVRDAARYFPAVARVGYLRSLFEVKTVLAASEINDGRPILLERFPAVARGYSVLGGKIDNIFDVIDALETEEIGP
jgi:glycine/D-amino acid oxidase-like deaminating enzyme